MARRPRSVAGEQLPAVVVEKVRSPLVIVLGSPAEVVRILAALPGVTATCYQFDLHQAERLRAALAEHHLSADVATAPDLWDLPEPFQTALYPAPRGGERDLKIDMVEQVFHVLRPHGTLLVWSPYDADQLFPPLLKKVFGRVHAPTTDGQTVFWCQRAGERSRRRHEIAFQARVGGGPSLRFVSRPGVFAYGRLDEGARALVETMLVEPGDRILDIGCGCGSNGIFAAQRSGPGGRVTFVDSNVRALALAAENARHNGVTNFEVFASSRVEGPAPGSVDVALANPPYFAQTAIARLFIERALPLLRPGGRFFLVTRQANQVGPIVVEVFGRAEAVEHRGYTIFGAWAHEGGEEEGSVFGELEEE